MPLQAPSFRHNGRAGSWSQYPIRKRRNTMGNQLKQPAGSFCWFELGTSDQNAAKEFYTGLFGWSFTDSPMGEGMGDYTMFNIGGKEVAALFQLSGPMQGMPPYWATYVCVDSADQTAAKAKSLGG